MSGWLRTRCAPCASALKRVTVVSWRTLAKYIETDGEQRAASFAYYAFFALFPLILLMVSIGSLFVDQQEVSNAVISFVVRYIPTMADEPKQSVVIQTISGVVSSWKSAGVIALLAIVWSALGLFHALVRGVNRAWGTLEYPWWRLPFKNMFMVVIVGSALLIGVVAPVLL
ncbi:MAG: P-type Ca2+ transporter type, partial [Chthoniobacter sp.]|nr:P-type Ca2+ transporter type [Chthoniobacter sp.]